MSRRTLETYLKDHLAGSRYAIRLMERCRESYDDPDLLSFLDELQAEVEEDRGVLESMLRRVGGSPSPIKEAGAVLLEQFSRVKHLEPSESSGSSLLERLETLSLGVWGKRSLWEALEEVSGGTGRFGGLDLGLLRRRADRQLERVEVQRLRAALLAFGREDRPGAVPERPLKGVLLDLDGTLIDTNEAHARAWVEAFADAGRSVGFERVRPLIGMGGRRLIESLTDIDPRSEEGEEVSRRHARYFLERHLEGCRPFDGARKLLERFRRDGLGLVVATSADREEMERALEVAGVRDLVQASTSGSDVRRAKPDPDVVTTALEKGGWEPDEALLLGDTPFDVEAGEKAGVGVVAVRCGGSGEAELGGALAVYDDPADLLARYESSPFGRRVAPNSFTRSS